MVSFNDIDLEMILKIISIDTTIISSRKNYSTDIPSRAGELYNGYKYSPKKIKIVGDLKRNTDREYLQAIDELASVLDVENEKPLYINDTGRFYYGVPIDDIGEDKICNGFGRITINFICYTPFSYNEKAKIYEGGNITTVSNEGNKECYPVINIGITKECHFVQVENTANRKKMLIGNLPKVSLPSISEKTDVLTDSCSNTTGWTTGTTSIDGDRSTGGTLAITSAGEGLMCGNFGDGSTTWHGVSARKNLGTQITDFIVEAFIAHNASGINGDPSVGKDMTDPVNNNYQIVSGSREEYYQVVCTALNVRSGPSTKYRKLRCLVKGNKITPLEWSGSWARIGTNEWCCCNAAYVKKFYKDNTVVTNVSETHKNFYTTGKAEIRQNADSKSSLVCTIPAAKIIRLLSSQKYYEPATEDGEQDTDTWYYKLVNSYNGNWGYIKNTSVAEATNVVTEYAEELETADDKTGVVELYGYSANNEQLFKLSMIDDNDYWEFNYPFATVGGKEFYKDNSVAPQPKISTETSATDDKLTVTQDYLLSGIYGDWTDFFGKIGIKRENDYWQVWFIKMENGNVVKQLWSTQRKVNTVPNSKLSYLTLYIGTAGENSKASGMSIEHIEVKNLNPVNPATQNIKKFQAGDVIKVDCYNNTIWLNDKSYNRFEIGSQFFPLEIGNNTIKIGSDDGDVSTSVIFNERYL